MAKISKANIAAAVAEREILLRKGEVVPEIVEELANLDPELVEDATKSVSLPEGEASHRVFWASSAAERALVPRHAASDWHKTYGKFDMVIETKDMSPQIGSEWDKTTPYLLFFVTKDHLAEADREIHDASSALYRHQPAEHESQR